MSPALDEWQKAVFEAYALIRRGKFVGSVAEVACERIEQLGDKLQPHEWAEARRCDQLLKEALGHRDPVPF